VGATVTIIAQTEMGEPGAYEQVRTGPDGSFILDPQRAWATPTTRLGVLAVKKGYGAAGVRIEPKGARTGLKLRLGRPVAVSGTVRDPAGKPVPGVRVSVVSGSLSGYVAIPEMIDALATRTDRSGRFRLPNLTDAAHLGVRYHHPRFARWDRWFNTSEQSDLSVTLQPAARIQGRALFEGTRRPAAGVTVVGQYHGQGGRGYSPPARAVTDRQGRYRLQGLYPGDYSVRIEYGKAAGQWVAAERDLNDLRPGKEAVAPDLVLTRGTLVTGRVLDAETRQPIADVPIQSNQTGSNRWRPGPRATTDREGRYQLRVPPGEWRVQAEGREGYINPWSEPREPPFVMVSAKGNKTANFTLEPGAMIRGVVLDPNGKPDGGATISGHMVWEHRVRPDGTFTIHGLREGMPGQFMVRGSNRQHQAFLEATPRKVAIDAVMVRLVPCVPVTGRITDAQGKPMAGAAVNSERRLNIRNGWTIARMDQTRSGADGRFTLWVLPGMPYHLRFSREGYGFLRKADFVAEAKGADMGALALIRADRSITGRVMDSDGNPVPKVRINAYSPEHDGEGHREFVTDAQGRYRITGLAPGKFQVNANHPTLGFDARNDVEAGATNIELVLMPNGPRPIRAKPRIKPGDAAPEIAVARWLNGKPGAKLKELRGRVVVLQFASPYNPAVEAANRRLNALQRRHGKRVAVLALYDASLPESETTAFVKSQGIAYPAGMVAESRQLGWNSASFRRYGIDAVPSVVLIDRRGRVRAVNPEPATLEAEVQRLARGL
jgi:protocatechuate 3,4-dioxygenase beta subunit